MPQSMLSIIMARTRRSEFAYEPDPDLAQLHMEGVVESLNGGPYDQELRRLVELWATSGSNGPNLQELFKRMPELDKQTAFGTTVLWTTETGRGYLEWNPGNFSVERPLSWEEHALSDFMLLITNPLWWKLGGPCERCRHYYLKKRKGQKRFCSQRCGSATTATAATQKSRAQRQKKKIQLAQKVMGEIMARSPRFAQRVTEEIIAKKPRAEVKKLEERVASEVSRRLIRGKKVRRARGAGVREEPCTVKWLTRALNKGKLRIPGV